MAMQSLTNQAADQLVLISRSDASAIRDMLLDAIKAKNELDLIRENIEAAARGGLPAKYLVDGNMVPRPVDLDISEAADMALAMGSLPAAQETDA